MKKFFADFKEFAMKGNIVDMAVGVIIGGAFGKIVSSLVNDILKARSDDKLEQKTNFQRLTSYGIYGPVNASTHILSEAEMKAIKPAELLQALNLLAGQCTESIHFHV